MAAKIKYPILFLHGLNCNDFKPVAYWGRIPDLLKGEGLQIYFGGQDSWGSIERNAEIIKSSLLGILESARCEKVNIIAHSKGGLEARYLISVLHMAPYVASLTTISTPHYGLKSVTRLYEYPHIMKCISHIINFYARLIGDKNPDSFKALYELSDQYCRGFNHAAADADGIFYQSYSTSMRGSADDYALYFTHRFIKKYDGENDGLVPVSSAKWGTCKHISATRESRGISHQNIVDIKRRDLEYFDIMAFYRGIIDELSKRGC